MRATEKDRKRLESEIDNLVKQISALGAEKVFLFGSLARGKISLFSDIDLVVLFDDPRSSRELSLWLYQNIHTRESVDIIAYNLQSFNKMKDTNFLSNALQESKLLYERSKN